eukprot:9319804-Pyramimonas_sp.AAC.1
MSVGLQRCVVRLIKTRICHSPLWNFLEARLIRRFPEIGVMGDSPVPAQRWVHIFPYLRGCLLPWAFAWLKTVANGWATSHRILQPHGRLSCRLGCPREPDA